MQIRELESKSKQLEKLLYSCMRDIFSTARTNQANIDGIELNCPDDPPVQSRIGKHFVNQRGVNESLALIERCKSVLAAMDVCPECGGTGTLYECEGEPVIVVNPPVRFPDVGASDD